MLPMAKPTSCFIKAVREFELSFDFAQDYNPLRTSASLILRNFSEYGQYDSGISVNTA